MHWKGLKKNKETRSSTDINRLHLSKIFPPFQFFIFASSQQHLKKAHKSQELKVTTNSNSSNPKNTKRSASMCLLVKQVQAVCGHEDTFFLESCSDPKCRSHTLIERTSTKTNCGECLKEDQKYKHHFIMSMAAMKNEEKIWDAESATKEDGFW